MNSDTKQLRDTWERIKREHPKMKPEIANAAESVIAKLASDFARFIASDEPQIKCWVVIDRSDNCPTCVFVNESPAKSYAAAQNERLDTDSHVAVRMTAPASALEEKNDH